MSPEFVQRALANIDLDRDVWIHGSAMVWRYFDLGASFIWAISGALLAARRGYDLTGIAAIALVSSTGGGLLRDGLFLQQGPPALVLTPIYIVIAAFAALLVWALGQNARAFHLFARSAAAVDAIGLGGFAVVGMQVALNAGLSLPGVVLVGVVNAVGGSVLRSLLLREIPEVFRPGELTAVASLAGCLVHLALTLGMGVDPRQAAAVTIVLVALLRVGSARFGLRTRPARGFVEPPVPPPSN
jgi:uncharacterized membrane protein YeiH